MIDAKTVKEVATKYIYDRCPAVVAVGMYDHYQLQQAQKQFILKVDDTVLTYHDM